MSNQRGDINGSDNNKTKFDSDYVEQNNRDPRVLSDDVMRQQIDLSNKLNTLGAFNRIALGIKSGTYSSVKDAFDKHPFYKNYIMASTDGEEPYFKLPPILYLYNYAGDKYNPSDVQNIYKNTHNGFLDIIKEVFPTLNNFVLDMSKEFVLKSLKSDGVESETDIKLHSLRIPFFGDNKPIHKLTIIGGDPDDSIESKNIKDIQSNVFISLFTYPLEFDGSGSVLKIIRASDKTDTFKNQTNQFPICSLSSTDSDQKFKGLETLYIDAFDKVLQFETGIIRNNAFSGMSLKTLFIENFHVSFFGQGWLTSYVNMNMSKVVTNSDILTDDCFSPLFTKSMKLNSMMYLDTLIMKNMICEERAIYDPPLDVNGLRCVVYDPIVEDGVLIRNKVAISCESAKTSVREIHFPNLLFSDIRIIEQYTSFLKPFHSTNKEEIVVYYFKEKPTDEEIIKAFDLWDIGELKQYNIRFEKSDYVEPEI